MMWRSNRWSMVVFALLGLGVLALYNNCAGDLTMVDGLARPSSARIQVTRHLVGKTVPRGTDVVLEMDTNLPISKLRVNWYKMNQGFAQPIAPMANDPRRLGLPAVGPNDAAFYFVDISLKDNPTDSVRVGPVYVTVTETPSPPTPEPNPPTTGRCGSAHGQMLATMPTGELCSSGVPSLVAANAYQYFWTCRGLHGGADASCVASIGWPSTPPTGSCGFFVCSGGGGAAYLAGQRCSQIGIQEQGWEHVDGINYWWTCSCEPCTSPTPGTRGGGSGGGWQTYQN